MLKAILLYFVVIYFSFPVANGDLLCYSCIMDGAATDRACENNPAAVTTSSPTVKCPTKYCKIQRLEYLDPPGQIFTFYRGCSDSSYDGVSEAGGFKQYDRVCSGDLCNDWDGISSVGTGGGGGGGMGSGGFGGGGFGEGGSNFISDFIMAEGIGSTGAGNQRVAPYVIFITFSVVMILYK